MVQTKDVNAGAIRCEILRLVSAKDPNATRHRLVIVTGAGLPSADLSELPLHFLKAHLPLDARSNGQGRSR